MNERIVLITGANRGLGHATAVALAERGMTVVLSARKRAEAEAAVAELDPGLSVIAEELDVTRDDQVAAVFEALYARFGRVDVLINNAAVIPEDHGATALTVPAALVAEALAINTLGPYRTSQRAIPLMNRAGYGRIVNVSSGMGALTDQAGGAPAYRISKTALHAVTRQFHDAAEANVKVNVVCPGWVRTDLGGPSATRSVAEGIVGIVWAATLPDDGPSGGFFRDGRAIPW